MGIWGNGPFDNDGAAGFLGVFATSPANAVASALQTVAEAPEGRAIDVDDGSAAWAASELLALAYGRGKRVPLTDCVLSCVARLEPSEEQRRLALDALSRIANPALSELACLWHEVHAGSTFHASLDDLRARLEAARSGVHRRRSAKRGDVIVLPGNEAEGEGSLVVQVLGTHEVAVFPGPINSDAEALARIESSAARRVPCSVAELARGGQIVGNAPVQQALAGKKLYVHEVGAMEGYLLGPANLIGATLVSFDEAQQYELFQALDQAAVRAVAAGTLAAPKVRSPDEREAALRERCAAKWRARREVSSPEPFGDGATLAALVSWMHEQGVDAAVHRFHEVASGAAGYERPDEAAERRSYAFAGMVALWRGSAPKDRWPPALDGQLPEAPKGRLMERALVTARALADQVITRDAELRLIWDDAPDRGKALRDALWTLRQELA
ncbi:MAG TPA: DUF4259 domain-containing protein [Polyangiaceae bacterium]|nr:DUF4259 domain-containing protein [Polyangiaceae bacterium]